MPDTSIRQSQTYPVREHKIPQASNLAGYPSGARQVKTSVSMASVSEERGGYPSRSIKTVGSNRFQYNKPQYKGKKIR